MISRRNDAQQVGRFDSEAEDGSKHRRYNLNNIVKTCRKQNIILLLIYYMIVYELN